MNLIEKVKEYWNRRPCNVKHSRKEIGTREYFDEVEARKYFVEPHILRFAEFEKWRGKKVLDIGCGIGTDTINFARAGAYVTAVDISEKSVEIAKKRANVFGLSNIKFYIGNAEELTSILAIEPYDLIYSFGVIHHSPNPITILNQAKHFMNKDSTLKIMVYNHCSWKVFKIAVKGFYDFWILNKPFENLKKSIANVSEAQTGCPVTFTYTKQQINEILNSLFFEVINLNINHIFPYKIKKYIKYNYKKTLFFKLLPKSIFRWMEKRWGWHICITAVLRG